MLQKSTLFVIAVVLQILILFGIIGRYEYVKTTGEVIYIEVTGFDPTDIFRGDYVNIAYSLPYSNKLIQEKCGQNKGGCNTSFEGGGFIIPRVTGNRITGIKEYSEDPPDSGELYFEVKNGWYNGVKTYTIEGIKNKKTYVYRSQSCLENLKVGDPVHWRDETASGTITWLESDEIQRAPDYDGPGYDSSEYFGRGVIKTISACIGSFQFQTYGSDRFFVKEYAGGPLEKEIRQGGIFAKWAISKNGSMVLLDVVQEKDIEK